MSATSQDANDPGETQRREADPPGEVTVVLVEDNPMVRRSIEATLRGGGYKVISVDSGERCLERLALPEPPVSLLISDVVMPEMTGDELLERARSLYPSLPVLFISGYDRSGLARQQPGSNEHFLQKPFDSQDLFAAVRNALAARPQPPRRP